MRAPTRFGGGGGLNPSVPPLAAPLLRAFHCCVFYQDKVDEIVACARVMYLPTVCGRLILAGRTTIDVISSAEQM